MLKRRDTVLNGEHIAAELRTHHVFEGPAHTLTIDSRDTPAKGTGFLRQQVKAIETFTVQGCRGTL
jgi:hypothetical protein